MLVREIRVSCTSEATGGVAGGFGGWVFSLLERETDNPDTWVFPKIGENLKSSIILIGFSIIYHHQFWGENPPIFGNNTHTSKILGGSSQLVRG